MFITPNAIKHTPKSHEKNLHSKTEEVVLGEMQDYKDGSGKFIVYVVLKLSQEDIKER